MVLPFVLSQRMFFGFLLSFPSAFLCFIFAPVKKPTAQNLWPNIIRINRAKRSFQKHAHCAFFLFAASAANFCKRDISSASEKAFLGFGTNFLVAQASTPSKRGILVDKNSLTSCQRYRCSVE